MHDALPSSFGCARKPDTLLGLGRPTNDRLSWPSPLVCVGVTGGPGLALILVIWRHNSPTGRSCPLSSHTVTHLIGTLWAMARCEVTTEHGPVGKANKALDL